MGGGDRAAMGRAGALGGLPPISVISGEPDRELDALARTIRGSVRVAGRDSLDALLDALAADAGPATSGSRTLDLLGHTTPRSALLRLGDWVIDARSTEVMAWVAGLAARRVLPRLGIAALRLLGCGTADTDDGRATMCALADALGIEVHGTRHLLYDQHYDGGGFRRCWEFLLVSASELRREPRSPLPSGAPRPPCPPARSHPPGPHRLDLDALPVLAPGAAAAGLPRVVPAGAARAILGLVRDDAGAPMPGPAAAPLCELALPSPRTGHYHLAHVLLGGAFLQVFPDGVAAPGIAYPVRDAPGLLRILDQM